MDGVLFDFEGRLQKLQIEKNKDKWKNIIEKDPLFYRNLEPISEVVEFFLYLLSLDNVTVRILSAYSSHIDESVTHKIQSLRELTDKPVECLFVSDFDIKKSLAYEPDTFFIDDNKSNVYAWNSVRSSGFLYPDEFEYFKKRIIHELES